MPEHGPDPAKLFGLAVAGLGGLNFIWGFLPQLKAPRITADLSVFAVGPGYVPILLLIGGLLATAAFLPGSERSRLAVAAVSVGGAAGAIVSLGTSGPVELVTTSQVSKGLGAVLLVIFGIVQAVVAIAGYVVGADFSHRAPVTAAPLGTPQGSMQPPFPPPLFQQPPFQQQQPVHQQPWWPPAAPPTPMQMPEPDEAVTGPQVVIGPEFRRDGEQQGH